MSRISIIALLFPPIQQIGAKRPLRLANYLAGQGHDVTVYAVHPGTFGLGDYCGVDPALLGDLDPRVKVIRTPSVHGFKVVIGWRDRIRRWRALRTTGGRPSLPTDLTSSSAPAVGGNRDDGTLDIVTRIQSLFAVPDTFSGWVLTTLPVMLIRSVFRRPLAIFVTAPPWSPLMLGVLVGKILRIPVHVDFRDPWTLNPYVQAPPLSVRLERWVVRNSGSVITTTEAMAADFRRVYPEKRDRVVAIYNGYDQSTRERVEKLRKQSLRGGAGPFVVCHLGTLYPARMPRRLAETLAQVAARWRQPRALRFRFLGRVWEPAPLVAAFAAAGVAEALELPGEVPSQQALEEAVKADALLLLQLGTGQQVPAKLFEYAFTGSPMVCAADEGSETARLVAGYGLGCVLSGDEPPEVLLHHLERLGHSKVEDDARAASFEADFDGKHLAAEMAHVVIGHAVGEP
jgi:glycosyltransferase involved in cell wall biosynthesis